MQSPEFFLRHNTQGEINIHNLILGNLKVNRLIFGTIKGIVVAIYFLIIPIIYERLIWAQNMLDSCAIPIPDFSLISFYLLMATVIWALPGGKTGELLEFVGGWVFFMLVLEPKNKKVFLVSSNSKIINKIREEGI